MEVRKIRAIFCVSQATQTFHIAVLRRVSARVRTYTAVVSGAYQLNKSQRNKIVYIFQETE